MKRTLSQRGGAIGIAVALALAAFASLAGQAQAGDRAQVEVVGFSADGRFAAYEQYGMQDGSGYPYSVITIVSLDQDTPGPTEPTSVILDDDAAVNAPYAAAIAAAREAVLALAGPQLEIYGIVPGETGTTLVLHPYSDLSTPLLEVPFSIGAIFSPYLQDVNLLRATLTPTTTEWCSEMAPGEVYLLGLDLLQAGGDAVTPLHHEDALEGEYFCPGAYRIHSVVVYPTGEAQRPGDKTYGMLVLMGVELFPGFEGPDTRFLGFGAMVDMIDG